MPPKRRATYPKDLRKEAKAAGRGLLTISLEQADGTLLEEQTMVGIHEAMFAKWAMAILFCDEVRKLPNLEQFVKKLMEREK